MLAASRSSAATARCLRRVGLQLVRGNQCVVGGPNGSDHRDDGPLGRFTRLSVPLKL